MQSHSQPINIFAFEYLDTNLYIGHKEITIIIKCIKTIITATTPLCYYTILKIKLKKGSTVFHFRLYFHI